MTRKTEYVSVEPSVMKWLRESSGRTPQEVARRIKASPKRVKMWESGEAEPPLGALEKLAKYYKRPLAAFMLPEPPVEPEPQDFRVFQDAEQEPLSFKTRLAIRRTRRLLSIASQIMEDLGEAPRALIGEVSLSDDPEEVAAEERIRLAVTLDEQLGWNKSRYRAFSQWRRALENSRVFVFQMSMSQDARGFSLYKGKLPAIVVNTADVINGRIFTLFHEYAHLLLRKAGICNLAEHGHKSRDAQRTEVFCNRFAGAFLIPPKGFADSRLVRRVADSRPLDEHDLGKIASQYKVSKEAVLVRMLTLGLISQQRYDGWKAGQHPPRQRRGGGGQSQINRCLSERGSSFISLVLDAKAKDIINYKDATEYLSLSLENYRKLGERIG